MQLLKAIFILTCLVHSLEGAKILLMMPMESKSHFNIHEAVARALGSKGHEVTLITPYPLTKAWPNVESHQVEKEDGKEDGPIQLDIHEAQTQSVVQTMMLFRDFIVESAQKLYQQPKVKSIIEEAKQKGKVYDIAIVDTFLNDFALPLASVVANHTMMLSVLNVPHWIAHEFRIPYPLSSLTTFFADYSKPITFMQRLESVVGSYSFILFRRYYFLPEMRNVISLHLPDAPSIEESMKKVSFILVNEDPVMSAARPSVPFSAKIGGIHLQPAKPLPKDLEEFMKSSGDHGVILFSFGSYFDTRLLPKETVEVCAKTFAKIKQKVIWKYHEPIKGISDNVKIVSWMPQRDILGHPKLRLFITHGGRLSSQETVFRGIPIIGIPLFGDQMHNIHRIADIGFGIGMSFFNITEEGLYNNINTVLTDNRYQQRVKELSAIFRDRLNSPADTVNYWVEYVIRHNGAFHLRNEVAEQLCFFQYHLLDVYGFLLAIVSLGIFILIKCIKLIFRLITKKKTLKYKRS